MKAVKKILVSMELHLDASIDKLDNLEMNVQLDKEKHMENVKEQEQTEPERTEAERVEAEIVYSPMVAEPQEYQYNACLLYTSPSPRDGLLSRMPSSA